MNKTIIIGGEKSLPKPHGEVVFDHLNNYYKTVPVSPEGYKPPELRNAWTKESLCWSGSGFWTTHSSSGFLFSKFWYCDPIETPRKA